MSNKLSGMNGEQIIFNHLQSLGFIGEIIETKMRLIRSGGRQFLAPQAGTKLGDIFGILQGRPLLVEVKSNDLPGLVRSTLKPHQHENLQAWRAHGGRSMIGWVRPEGFALFDYPLIWTDTLRWDDYEISR